jgi:hypothetical protein
MFNAVDGNFAADSIVIDLADVREKRKSSYQLREGVLMVTHDQVFCCVYTN